MSFFGELRRRNVVKVAVAYAIVGWLLVEVSSVLLPAFEAPDWVLRVIVLLIVIGFVLALVLSWAYELTPDGIKLEREVAAGESITHVTGRKLDFAIIGALVLALGFVVYNYESEEDEVVAGVLPNSVAVLLCDNLSPNPDDAYFAAGIHEEILNQLVKLRNLNVIARTSVLQYADAPPSIPQIAAELNVGAVMECSVRYAGTAIVVTAQLIDPDTNSHLWSDTYPGDMSDLSTVFAMQADIAMNIANAIGAEFSVEEQASIEKIPTASIEAYGYYLAALEFSSLFDTRNLELMDRAIEVDPNFALAHATRSFGLAGRLYYGGFIEQLNVTRDDAEREVLETATRALELDPDLGLAYRARALIHEINWRWADAEQAHELAVQSDQNNPAVLQGLASLKRRIGEYDEGVKLAERARELDPANFNSYHLLGIANMYARNYDSALAAFETAITINPTNPPTYIGMAIVQNALGRTADTIESLEELDRLRGAGPLNVAILATGYANADRPAEAERFFLELEGMSEERSVGSANLAMAHIALGNEEEALRWFRQAIDDRALVDGTALSHMKANHWRDPLLDTTAFQQLRDRVGAL